VTVKSVKLISYGEITVNDLTFSFIGFLNRQPPSQWFSGLKPRVDLKVNTDVSEELTASIFRDEILKMSCWSSGTVAI
jgi:hypothetical protein